MDPDRQQKEVVQAYFVKLLRAYVGRRHGAAAEVARRTGMAAPHVSNMVRGQRQPGTEFMVAFARILGRPYEELEAEALREAGFTGLDALLPGSDRGEDRSDWDNRRRAEEILRLERDYTEEEIAAGSAEALASFEGAIDDRHPREWTRAIRDEIRLARLRRAKDEALARGETWTPAAPSTPAPAPRVGLSRLEQAIRELIDDQPVRELRGDRAYTKDDLWRASRGVEMADDDASHTVAEWKAMLLRRAEAMRRHADAISLSTTPPVRPTSTPKKENGH